ASLALVHDHVVGARGHLLRIRRHEPISYRRTALDIAKVPLLGRRVAEKLVTAGEEHEHITPMPCPIRRTGGRLGDTVGIAVAPPVAARRRTSATSAKGGGRLGVRGADDRTNLAQTRYLGILIILVKVELPVIHGIDGGASRGL